MVIENGRICWNAQTLLTFWRFIGDKRGYGAR
jgi:hypothetical protein